MPKIICIEFDIFHEKKSCNRRVFLTPQMPLTFIPKNISYAEDSNKLQSALKTHNSQLRFNILEIHLIQMKNLDTYCV